MSTRSTPMAPSDGPGVALDLVLERAGRGRQLDREGDGRAVDDDVLDHLEGDDVAPELGLLDGAQRVDDGGLGQAGHGRWGSLRARGSDGRCVSIVPRAGVGDAGLRGPRRGSPSRPSAIVRTQHLRRLSRANLARPVADADESRHLDTMNAAPYPRPHPSRAGRPTEATRVERVDPVSPVRGLHRSQEYLRTCPPSTSGSWTWSSATARPWPSTTSTSRSRPASSSACSARPAAARPPPCG